MPGSQKTGIAALSIGIGDGALSGTTRSKSEGYRLERLQQNPSFPMDSSHVRCWGGGQLNSELTSVREPVALLTAKRVLLGLRRSLARRRVRRIGALWPNGAAVPNRAGALRDPPWVGPADVGMSAEAATFSELVAKFSGQRPSGPI